MAVVIIAVFVISFAIGAIVTRIVLSRRASGDLRVDTSDPDDSPYLFLELGEDVRNIMRKKYVILEVKVENYISLK